MAPCGWELNRSRGPSIRNRGLYPAPVSIPLLLRLFWRGFRHYRSWQVPSQGPSRYPSLLWNLLPPALNAQGQGEPYLMASYGLCSEKHLIHLIFWGTSWEQLCLSDQSTLIDASLSQGISFKTFANPQSRDQNINRANLCENENGLNISGFKLLRSISYIRPLIRCQGRVLQIVRSWYDYDLQLKGRGEVGA